MIFEIIKRAGFADGTESPDSTHDLGFESDDQENIYDDGKRIIGGHHIRLYYLVIGYTH